MPSRAPGAPAPPPTASASSPSPTPSASPLPSTFPLVRARLGTHPLPDVRASLHVSDSLITCGDVRVAHADVIMHAVAEATPHLPASIYAQLETADGELRIVPDDPAALKRIFDALCAGAAIAEDKLAEEEGRVPAGEEEPMFTRMGDGRVGMVDFDAMLDTRAVEGEAGQFDDAEEEGEAAGEKGSGEVKGNGT